MLLQYFSETITETTIQINNNIRLLQENFESPLFLLLYQDLDIKTIHCEISLNNKFFNDDDSIDLFNSSEDETFTFLVEKTLKTSFSSLKQNLFLQQLSLLKSLLNELSPFIINKDAFILLQSHQTIYFNKK